MLHAVRLLCYDSGAKAESTLALLHRRRAVSCVLTRTHTLDKFIVMHWVYILDSKAPIGFTLHVTSEAGVLASKRVVMGFINSSNLVEVVEALEMYTALVGGNISRFWFN